MDEREALRLLAEIIHGAGDAVGLVEVATFGGGDLGIPGIKVEDAAGAKFFLVRDLTGPVRSRPGFPYPVPPRSVVQR